MCYWTLRKMGEASENYGFVYEIEKNQVEKEKYAKQWFLRRILFQRILYNIVYYWWVPTMC